MSKKVYTKCQDWNTYCLAPDILFLKHECYSDINIKE